MLGSNRPFEPTEAAALLMERMDPRTAGPLEVEEPEGVPMLAASLAGRFRVAFTTRHGGVSGGSYASLNLSGRSGDDAAAVGENRRRLANALRALDEGTGDGHPPTLVSPRQVHGVRVVGTAEYLDNPRHPAADGLTVHSLRDEGLAALLLYADCVPVVLAGEVDMAVLHGGWRGMVAGVVQEGARALTAPPGAAVVGPSVGPCCYRVGEGVRDAFVRRYGDDVVRDDRVDLWLAAERALAEVEVPGSRVWNPRLCTMCNTDLFFSHRAEGGVTGRQGGAVWPAA